MTELLPTLREYADRGDRKMNVATLPLDIYELAIAALARALTGVSEQAEDEGLWFQPKYITEDVFQRALRRLHEAVEGKTSAECARAVLD